MSQSFSGGRSNRKKDSEQAGVTEKGAATERETGRDYIFNMVALFRTSSVTVLRLERLIELWMAMDA